MVALAAAAAVASAGSARAEGARPGWISATPPSGWEELPGLSRSVATTLEQSGAFGDLPGEAGAQAFADPGFGAFYLSWLIAGAPAGSPPAAVRGAIDHVRASRAVSSPQAGSTEELAWSEALADGVAEARLDWRHLSNETRTMVRALAWVTPSGAPRLVRAECVISTSGGEAPQAAVSACQAALDSVTVTPPAGERGELASLPASAPAGEDGAAEPAGAAAGGADLSGGAPPDTIGAAPAGEQKVLYAGPTAEDKDSMSRWLILAGAALLLAAVYLTFRSRRRAPEDGGGAASADDEE
ncbi:MAG TPA: hypothetical protein VKZ63_04255 [Kofleriaceae bacterium]|nr:hypothetical protein [Kofleriaceae bacterium]